MNICPDEILELRPNEVFVFGSNEAGRHGRGAAKDALRWGAVYGKGVGLAGKTYGIPTKDAYMKVLPLQFIFNYVNSFVKFTSVHKEKIFLVTRIGCGLAGYKPEQIAPLFCTAYGHENIYLPKDFIEILYKHNLW